MTATNKSSKHHIVNVRGKAVSGVAELTELVDVTALHTTLGLRRRGKTSGGFSRRPWKTGGSFSRRLRWR